MSVEQVAIYRVLVSNVAPLTSILSLLCRVLAVLGRAMPAALLAPRWAASRLEWVWSARF